MLRSGVLTLLSDFGERDVYVGVMKGVIAEINLAVSVIDLTHQIPPQNLALARFALMSAVPFFPPGTVHVAIVDPGVGGNRRAIALALGNNPADPIALLVAPDNGLVSGVMSQHPVIAAVELTNSRYWRTTSPSTTFHGRDIFAPVGAHLASGVNLEEVGRAIDPASLSRLDLPPCQIQPSVHQATRIQGCIQAWDHFGNLITNIPGKLVTNSVWRVEVNHQKIPGQRTYSDRPLGTLLALVGSHGWVEIAANGGNAQEKLPLDLGKLVEVVIGEPTQ